MLLHISFVTWHSFHFLRALSWPSSSLTSTLLTQVSLFKKKKKFTLRGRRSQQTLTTASPALLSLSCFPVTVTQCFTLGNSSLQLPKHVVSPQVKQEGHGSTSVSPAHIPSYIYCPSNLGLKLSEKVYSSWNHSNAQCKGFSSRCMETSNVAEISGKRGLPNRTASCSRWRQPWHWCIVGCINVGFKKE